MFTVVSVPSMTSNGIAFPFLLAVTGPITGRVGSELTISSSICIMHTMRVPISTSVYKFAYQDQASVQAKYTRTPCLMASLFLSRRQLHTMMESAKEEAHLPSNVSTGRDVPHREWTSGIWAVYSRSDPLQLNLE